MPHHSPRCPICFNAGWHDRAPFRDCTHCELSVLSGVALAPIRGEIDAALAGAGRSGAQSERWRLSAVAIRNAAWALERSWRDGAWQPERTTPHEVVLGMIGRAADLPAIERLAGLPGFNRAIAVIDAQEAVDTTVRSLRIAARRLDDDFGAQRNHLQALAAAGNGDPPWVLQLDTDEWPSPDLLRSLGWMVRAADRDGLRSIGLPRINLVDGVRSALFPDIQYRLNRADIAFRNTVHERPEVPFAQTTLGLAGAIEHRLDSARVRARSKRYEAMCDGAGRPEDEAALLQPFDPARMLMR